MRLYFFKNSKCLLESPFNNARVGLPSPTHVGTPLKAIFHSVIPLCFTEATALAKPYKFGQLKA